MSAYGAFSASYDGLMRDADYRKRTAFFVSFLRDGAIPVRDVLDLGCGSGTVAWLLSRQGFRVVAADSSEEMLTEAVRKGDAFRNADGDAPPPLFICQSMPRLKLASPVDAAVSTFDSLNYLTRERDLRETFRRVARSLKSGGRFVFDVNTAAHFRRMDAQTYLDETDDAFCAWRTFFSEKKQVCTWQVDLFRRRPDGAWERSFEEHRERAWSADELREFLRDAGFVNVQIFGDLSRKPPKEEESRWTVLAEKEKIHE